MEQNQMKLVCEKPPGTLRTLTSTNNIALAANALKTTPGVGQPFLMFASLPGVVVQVDFDLHADWAGHGNVVNSDATKNAEMIQAMLDAPPLDALTFAE
jgi:hypothetical protein